MLAFFCLLPALAAVASDGAPVKIHIQIIEASTTSKEFDPKLTLPRDAIAGYTGARLLDEVDATVQKGATVSVAVPALDKKQLKVKVREIDKDGTVKLTVSIESLHFSADTTHRKPNATVVVRKKISDEKGLFLAVTNRP